MSDVTVKSVEELEFYEGAKALPGIRFRYAGKALGVRAWGMNVVELEPGCTSYPEHEHVTDGQEEVYACLRGTAVLHAGPEQFKLAPGILARVGPAQKRKIVAGPVGATILAIGGTPGKAYEPRR